MMAYDGSVLANTDSVAFLASPVPYNHINVKSHFVLHYYKELLIQNVCFEILNLIGLVMCIIRKKKINL
jgi:hypothetical protein